MVSPPQQQQQEEEQRFPLPDLSAAPQIKSDADEQSAGVERGGGRGERVRKKKQNRNRIGTRRVSSCDSTWRERRTRVETGKWDRNTK